MAESSVSSPDAAPKKTCRFAPMTEYKKEAKQPRRERETRIISLGQYHDRTKPGPYLNVRLHKIPQDEGISKANPLLGPAGWKLDDPYFDVGWVKAKDCHVCKTLSPTHFKAVAALIQLRCPSLKLEIDESNGKWYDNEGMMFWNPAREQVAFIGLAPFKTQIETILSAALGSTLELEALDRILWADQQAGLLATGLKPDIVETTSALIEEVVVKFGCIVNLYTNDVPSDE